MKCSKRKMTDLKKNKILKKSTKNTDFVKVICYFYLISVCIKSQVEGTLIKMSQKEKNRKKKNIFGGIIACCDDRALNLASLALYIILTLILVLLCISFHCTAVSLETLNNETQGNNSSIFTRTCSLTINKSGVCRWEEYFLTTLYTLIRH